jgi:acetyltransferase-like isoleucine patch superfamily enzyme
MKLLLKLYTYLASRRFSHFGQNSLIKPFLNSSNEKYISVGDYADIGMFSRITVSTEFGGHRCMSKNKIRLSIGDNVDIGNNTFISANNDVSIGNHVIMSTYVFITDHDHGIKDVNNDLHHQKLTNNGYVHIEDNVFLGTKCSILKNVTIGTHSSIGANSVVTHDIPAYSIAVGNPAKVISHYDFKTKKWTSSGI